VGSSLSRRPIFSSLDSSFYHRSLFDSAHFLANTFMLMFALGLGAYCVLNLGENMPIPLWLFIVAVMVGIAGSWVREIWVHGKMRERLNRDPDSISREELLRLAAYWPTVGLGHMIFIAFTLLFCLTAVLRHYGHFIGFMGHIAAR
jgi:hypothetical protein